jgi:hypothetical protein
MKGAPFLLVRPAAFLLVPLAVFLLVRNDLNQVGSIDPFIYLGYARDFDDVIRRYGMIYYATRLSHILPNALAFSALGEHAGYFLLRYFQLVAATVAIHAIARNYAEEAVAWLITLFFCSHVWLLRALLWDHYEGSLVIYALIGIALLTPRKGDETVRHVAAGVAFAAASDGNPMGLFVAAAYGPTWFMARAGWPWAAKKRSILAAIAGLVLGYIILLVAMMIVSPRTAWTLDLLQLDVSTRIVASAGKTYFASLSDTLGKREFHEPLVLVFSILAAAGAAIAASDSDRRRQALGALAFAVLIAAVFGALHLLLVGVLSLHYYLIYALPACVAALAAFAGQWRPASTRAAIVVVSAFVVLQGVFWFVAGALLTGEPKPAVPLALPLVAMAVAFLAAGIAIATTGRSAPGTAIAIGLVMLSSGTLFLEPMFARIYGDSARRDFEWDVRDGALYLQDFVVAHVPRGDPVRFWYSNANPSLNAVQAIYLWDASRVAGIATTNAQLPELDDLARTRLATARHVVVLGTAAEADAALAALQRAGYPAAAVLQRGDFKGRQWPGYSAVLIALQP